MFTARYGPNLPAQFRLFLQWPCHGSRGRSVAGLSPRFRYQDFRAEISDGQSGTETAPSSLCFSVFPSQHHSTNAPHSSSSRGFCYQKETLAKPGRLPESKVLLEVGERWIEEYFQVLMFIVYRVGKCAVRMNSLEMRAPAAPAASFLRITVYEACVPPPKLFFTRSILT